MLQVVVGVPLPGKQLHGSPLEPWQRNGSLRCVRGRFRAAPRYFWRFTVHLCSIVHANQEYGTRIVSFVSAVGTVRLLEEHLYARGGRRPWTRKEIDEIGALLVVRPKSECLL
jgi:hypothetical protein